MICLIFSKVIVAHSGKYGAGTLFVINDKQILIFFIHLINDVYDINHIHH